MQVYTHTMAQYKKKTKCEVALHTLLPQYIILHYKMILIIKVKANILKVHFIPFGKAFKHPLNSIMWHAAQYMCKVSQRILFTTVTSQILPILTEKMFPDNNLLRPFITILWPLNPKISTLKLTALWYETKCIPCTCALTEMLSSSRLLYSRP